LPSKRRDQNRILLSRLKARKAVVPARLVELDLKLAVFATGRPVWRRVRAAGGMNLRSFNRLVRRALEWPESHAYVLELRRPWDSRRRIAVVERKGVSLADIVGVGDGLGLGYSYGRGWWVDAVVERIRVACGPVLPACLGGSGWVDPFWRGTPDYYNLRLALEFPDTPLHGRAVELRRIGLAQESGCSLDLERVNETLRRGRYLGPPKRSFRGSRSGRGTSAR
jgi:hypothetical protein